MLMVRHLYTMVNNFNLFFWGGGENINWTESKKKKGHKDHKAVFIE